MDNEVKAVQEYYNPDNPDTGKSNTSYKSVLLAIVAVFLMIAIVYVSESYEGTVPSYAVAKISPFELHRVGEIEEIEDMTKYDNLYEYMSMSERDRATILDRNGGDFTRYHRDAQDNIKLDPSEMHLFSEIYAPMLPGYVDVPY